MHKILLMCMYVQRRAIKVAQHCISVVFHIYHNWYVHSEDLNYARHHIVRLPQRPAVGLEY